MNALATLNASVDKNLPQDVAVALHGKVGNCGEFAIWSAGVLELSLSIDDGYWVATADPEEQAYFGEVSEIRLPLSGDAISNTTAARPEISTEDEAFSLLWHALQEREPVIACRPAADPAGIHQLANRLFEAYQVDGGGVHLGGCSFESVPFLRITMPKRDDPHELEHFFFDAHGEPVPLEFIDQFGLDNLVPAVPPLPRMDPNEFKLLVSAGKRELESQLSQESAGRVHEPLVTLVWVRHAVGKLQFTIGEATAYQEFSGWAQDLKPPFFECQETGLKTMHLAAADDGRIVAAEAIGTCGKSGRRVLEHELVTCSVTDQRVLPEFAKTCPVSEEPALADEFAPCKQCHQLVSLAVLKGQTCRACRQLAVVPRDDPRVMWLVGEWPLLEKWRTWRLSETAEVYIAQASGWWERLLLVVEKDSLHLRYAASRSRFRNEWLPLDDAERKALFGA